MDALWTERAVRITSLTHRFVEADEGTCANARKHVGLSLTLQPFNHFSTGPNTPVNTVDSVVTTLCITIVQPCELYCASQLSGGVWACRTPASRGRWQISAPRCRGWESFRANALNAAESCAGRAARGAWLGLGAWAAAVPGREADQVRGRGWAWGHGWAGRGGWGAWAAAGHGAPGAWLPGADGRGATHSPYTVAHGGNCTNRATTRRRHAVKQLLMLQNPPPARAAGTTRTRGHDKNRTARPRCLGAATTTAATTAEPSRAQP